MNKKSIECWISLALNSHPVSWTAFNKYCSRPINWVTFSNLDILLAFIKYNDKLTVGHCVMMQYPLHCFKNQTSRFSCSIFITVFTLVTINRPSSILAVANFNFDCGGCLCHDAISSPSSYRSNVNGPLLYIHCCLQFSHIKSTFVNTSSFVFYFGVWWVSWSLRIMVSVLWKVKRNVSAIISFSSS